MPHPVTCGACSAAFSIPDDVWEKRVQGQVATLKCRQCKSPIQIDGRARKGSSAVSTEGKHKKGAVSNELHAQPALSPVPQPVQLGFTAPSDAKSQVKAQTLASLPDGVGIAMALDKRQPLDGTVAEPKRFGAPSSGSTLNATPEIGHRLIRSTEPDTSQPRLDSPLEAQGTPPVALSATKSARQPLSPANRDPASPRTLEPSQSKVASSASAAVIAPHEASTTKTVGSQRKVDAKSSPIAHEESRDRKADYSWVVSIDPENDREMTMAQISAAISEGTITYENIVWREGMSEWVPISKVPELILLAKHANAARSSAGGRAGLGSPNATARSIVSEPAAQRGVSTAKSMGSMKRENDIARGSTDVTKATRRSGEGYRDSPVAPATTKTAVGGARGGGPPPLRKAQSATRDERAAAMSSEGERALAAQSLGSLASMGTRNAAPEPKSPVGGPPPLPLQPVSTGPVLAESRDFADARDVVLRDHSPASLPVVAAIEPPRPPTGAISTAPSPSDIAALIKMRPKFPKWLPFAVLGGVVLLTVVFAVLSWFGNDGASDNGKSSSSRDKSMPPLPANSTPVVNKTGTTGSEPEPVKTSEIRETSSGFANQFAQAAAKQRPTARFDRDSAEKALAAGFAKAAACHNKGDPTGTASITLSISPSGQILSVTVAPPFATTFTAECIRNALAEVRVPPFQGAPARLAHSISIR